MASKNSKTDEKWIAQVGIDKALAGSLCATCARVLSARIGYECECPPDDHVMTMMKKKWWNVPRVMPE